MDASLAQTAVHGVGGAPRGSFRGRGGSAMRGAFDRGRGRGMQIGRGMHMRGGMGRGGMVGMGAGLLGPLAPPAQGMMMGGRGMSTRGWPGYRGMAPRNGPHIHGSRQPMYTQPAIKQHTGAENNKTVSPAATTSAAKTSGPSNDGIAAVNASGTQQGATNATAAVSNAQTDAAAAGNSGNVAPVTTNGNSNLGHQNYTRGGGRGRGGQFPRGSSGGGARGGYNQHGNAGMYGNQGYAGAQNSDPNQMGGMRRGGMQRGRGGYGQSMPRPQMHQQHIAHTQQSALPPIKRGAPGGPGPKRGRYEGGPYSQRPSAPKYHQQQQQQQQQQQHQPPPMQPPHPAYGAHHTQHHQPQPTHHGYPHDPSQTADAYAHSYAQPAAQPAYNGYGQNTGYPAHPQAPPANVSYATHHTAEYDQSQYQNYGANYGAQQEARYQGYGQDYTQQYGAPAVDYNQAQQADYAQQSATEYDVRGYPGYDAQAYQQNYSNTAGYY